VTGIAGASIYNLQSFALAIIVAEVCQGVEVMRLGGVEM